MARKKCRVRTPGRGRKRFAVINDSDELIALEKTEKMAIRVAKKKAKRKEGFSIVKLTKDIDCG